MSQKSRYQYRLRPCGDLYIAEYRVVYGDPNECTHRWRDCKVYGFFIDKGPFVASEREGRRLIDLHKAEEEKYQESQRRRDEIQKSREIIYVD